MKPAALVELIDSSGRTIRLGKPLGKGGEGTVFAVDGPPTLAAKIYHQTPVPADDLDKLNAMVDCRSKELDAISAWPQSVLYHPRRRAPWGILIPRINEARHLHELYGTSTRRRYFPDARWHHLVLAARNVAAAFESLHAAGIIVGDVNQGNLLVDQHMCVRFIDCDSFQITSHGKTFLCPVATPHFTPPELQSKKLRETPRNVSHDRFGLAVLLFHLLFVGRHPFAGRFYGAGDLNIEKAIAERRFAFSKDKSATLVEPPPASLLLDDIPASLGTLFEQAFRVAGESGRPTALQWVHELEHLIQQRKGCSFDPAHVYYAHLKECPWCRIQDEGGPAFFVVADSISRLPTDQLDHLEDKLSRLTVPAFPGLESRRLQVPQALRPKWLAKGATISKLDFAAVLLVSSVFLCFWPAGSTLVLTIGTLAALGGGGLLLLSREGKSRRNRALELGSRLEQMQTALKQHSQEITARHRGRQAAFDKAVAELKAECEHYRAADTQLQDVLVVQRTSQQDRFLSRHLIQNHFAHIPGVTQSLASVLQSYGIESAADIETIKLIGIPMLTPGLSTELMTWRERLERDFEFKPEHGVTFSDMRRSKDLAVNRFKIAQARRILMASKQLDSLAAASREQLSRELSKYDQLASQARDVANELHVFQSGRRLLERLLNRSAVFVVAAALAIPAVAWLIRLLFE